MNSPIEIIHEPRAKSWLRRLTEAGITGLAWGTWFYLLMPIVNIIMWLLSGEIIFTRLFSEQGLAIFFELVQQMGIIIICCLVIIQGWSYYNYFRFGKKNRRKSMQLGAEEERLLAQFHDMDQQLLHQLRSKKEIVWPPMATTEIEVEPWVERKRRKLAGHEVTELLEEHHIHLARFHDIHPQGEPSIALSIMVVVFGIYATALLVVLLLD